MEPSFAAFRSLGRSHSVHHRHGSKPKLSDGVVGTVVKDEIELDIGYGWAGKAIEKLFVTAQMKPDVSASPENFA